MRACLLLAFLLGPLLWAQAPVFPYGAVYFRKSNPPEEDWERDHATAARLGMNTFRHWVMWSAIEVAPGKYDWRDYDRTCRGWAARHPQHVRSQSYEDLLAEPEAEIRALLAFCGLPFEPACLDFHKAERSVRTPSAAQVRQPLRRDTARAAAYGDLLVALREPLRR